jgi:hypothetical protein
MTGGSARTQLKKKRARGAHTATTWDWICGVGQIAKKAPLEAAGSGSGFGRKMTKGFAAWYFLGQDKLAGVTEVRRVGLFVEWPPYCTVTLFAGASCWG